MTEIIIVTTIAIFLLVIVPRLAQYLDDLDKKYEQENEWKKNITQHFNGHHNQVNSFGYQDYKYDNYDNDYSEY